jgi:hypothetical protein
MALSIPSRDLLDVCIKYGGQFISTQVNLAGPPRYNIMHISSFAEDHVMEVIRRADISVS